MKKNQVTNSRSFDRRIQISKIRIESHSRQTLSGIICYSFYLQERKLINVKLYLDLQVIVSIFIMVNIDHKKMKILFSRSD